MAVQRALKWVDRKAVQMGRLLVGRKAVQMAHLKAACWEQMMAEPKEAQTVAHSVAMLASPLAAPTVDMWEVNSAGWWEASWVAGLVEHWENSRAALWAVHWAQSLVAMSVDWTVGMKAAETEWMWVDWKAGQKAYCWADKKAERRVYQSAASLALHWAAQMVARWERELVVMRVGSKVDWMVARLAVW